MDANRLTELGRFFETADLRSQDLRKALDLYCRAASVAHPEALARVGWLYEKGLGVDRDPAVAATMFRWAAALGDDSVGSIAQGMQAGPDVVPNCLAEMGIHSLAALRAIRSAMNGGRQDGAETAASTTSAEPDEPTPVVENPAQFRTTAPPAEHRRLVQLVLKEAGKFKLDPRLVLAVMQTESSFDARARSSKNARGLMQLIPETARRFNVRDLNNPAENLRGGMAYLRWLLDYYHGDVVLALAAYNSGEGTVDRHRGVPPYRETISYVQRIRALYPFDRHPFEPNKASTIGNRAWVVEGLAANGMSLSQIQ
jgi:hypothetical protein